MNILITGAFGFIGSAISQYLHSKGFYIYMCTRHYHLKPSWLVNGQVICSDYSSPYFCDSIPSDLFAFINCVGLPASKCSINPNLAQSVNCDLSLKFANFCIDHQIDHYISFSTIHVYDSPLANLYTESSPSLNHHPYATSNHLAENLLSSIAQERTFITVFRLANMFGPVLSPYSSPYNLFLNNIIYDSLRFKTISIRSSVDFYINSVPTSFLLRLLDDILVFSSSRLHPFLLLNCCSNISFSLSHIANIVLDTVSDLYKYTPLLKSSIIKTDTNCFSFDSLYPMYNSIYDSSFLPRDITAFLRKI